MTGLKTRRPSGERGVTLIETLLVLGVATAFIGGALVLYDQAEQSAAKRATLANIYGIIAAVRNSYAIRNDYQGLSFEAVGIPAENQSAWDVTINLEGVNATGASGTTDPEPFFRIGVEDITEQQCITLSTVFGDDYSVLLTGRPASASGGLPDYATPPRVSNVGRRETMNNSISCNNVSGDYIYIFVP